MDVMRSRKRAMSNVESGDNFGPIDKRMRDGDTIEIETRLEGLIMRVGDKSTSSLESNLEGLTAVLDADLTTYKRKITEIILDCVTASPDKTTVYTTLVGLLNAKNYNFGAEFVNVVINSMRELMKRSEWDNARHTFRFVSDLINCHVISAASLLTLYDVFVDAMLEEESENGSPLPQTRTDFFAHCLLSSLPWVGRHLYERRESDLDRLLVSIEGYIETTRRRKHGTEVKAYIQALRVFHSDKPQPQEEYLECLWYQIKRLRSDLWIEKHIARPYMAFESILARAMQHNLPARANLTPPVHRPPTSADAPPVLYPVPSVVFRIFDYTDCPEILKLAPPTRSKSCSSAGSSD